MGPRLGLERTSSRWSSQTGANAAATSATAAGGICPRRIVYPVRRTSAARSASCSSVISDYPGKPRYPRFSWSLSRSPAPPGAPAPPRDSSERGSGASPPLPARVPSPPRYRVKAGRTPSSGAAPAGSPGYCSETTSDWYFSSSHSAPQPGRSAGARQPSSTSGAFIIPQVSPCFLRVSASVLMYS